ncbi:MAG: hypothetical protein LBB21_03055 [Holosporaceae bacterium]|jgi:energy-coupling factor transporter ATP-binding protein EcfA2|nr:hypothetical protein [Holosporaceae bacterium]
MKLQVVSSAVISIMLAMEGMYAMDSRDEVERLAANVDGVTKAVRREIKERAVDATRVLLVGSTGSGKSTLVHLLADIPLIVRKDSMSGGLCLVPEKELFAVAPGPDSVTTTPGFWSDRKGVVYCDCPGFDDSRGSDQEIINAFATDQLLTELSRVKILLVTAVSEIMAGRGHMFKEQLRRLTCLIPDIKQLQIGSALVITKITGSGLPPVQYVGGLIGSGAPVPGDPIDILLRFFAANPERVFGFPFPIETDLGKLYRDKDGSVGATKERIRKFLHTDPVVNPTHCVSLNDSSLLKLSLVVGKFCNVRLSLQEFADLISARYREEKDIDKLRVWLSGIDALMGNKQDSPNALVLHVRSTVPFSHPEILGKFDNILGKIGDFQYLQHFLRQILKTGAIKDEYRRIFAEGAALNLAAVLNPSLLATRVELERLLQLAEAEKEKALLEKLGYIVGHYGLDPVTSMIGVRSADILGMNIFQKHSTVSEIYTKKFLPFQELLIPVELNSVKRYIDDIKIGAEPVKPSYIRGVFNRGWGDRAWNTVYDADMQFLMNKYRMLDIAYNRWGWDFAEVHTSHAYGGEWDNIRMYNHYMALENSERDQIYAKAKSDYEAAKARAEATLIPTVFDGLVDSVNGFLKRLIRG